MKRLFSHPNPKLRKLWFSGDIENSNPYYRFCRRSLHVIVSLFWNVRVFNRHLEPNEGGTVYICNHQSFFDPVLMAYSLRRPVNFMARDSLFKIPGFGLLIAAVNAFPVKRDTADTGAMKEAISRIKKGGTVVIFAEGTRTKDGKIKKFLPGVALLSQRIAIWTVPVLIDGAYECWPKGYWLPRPGKITVQYCKPISQEEARQMKPAEFIEKVRRQLIDLQTDVRRRTGRSQLKYDEE